MEPGVGGPHVHPDPAGSVFAAISVASWAPRSSSPASILCCWSSAIWRYIGSAMASPHAATLPLLPPGADRAPGAHPRRRRNRGTKSRGRHTSGELLCWVIVLVAVLRRRATITLSHDTSSSPLGLIARTWGVPRLSMDPEPANGDALVRPSTSIPPICYFT